MKRFLIIILCFAAFSFPGQAQKIFSEGTISYNLGVETGSGQPKMADMFDGATNTVYLKAKKSRVDLISGLGKEITIYDEDKGSAVILKDYSGQKLMITMTPSDWKQNTDKYSDITFTPTGKKKKIGNYDCIEAIATLKDGTHFSVWYTPEVKIENKSYDVQFENLPGLPVQYELKKGNLMFRFTLSNISYDKVPSSKFDIPTSGYRVMTYQETLQKRN